MRYIEKTMEELRMCPKCEEEHEPEYFRNRRGEPREWCFYCCETHRKWARKIRRERRKARKNSK